MYAQFRIDLFKEERVHFDIFDCFKITPCTTLYCHELESESELNQLTEYCVWHPLDESIIRFVMLIDGNKSLKINEALHQIHQWA